VGISSTKKGGMKKAAAHRVGPRRQLQGRHVDGNPLGLTLQAVLKDGSSLHRLVAVLKPLQPSRGAQVRDLGLGRASKRKHLHGVASWQSSPLC